MKDGKVVAEEHEQHKVDGQTLLKKDVYNHDGHVTGQQIVNKDGHLETKAIGH